MSLQLRRQRTSALIILLAVMTVIAFVLWSVWAELDQITRARGQVIPTGRTQIVQSADGGVIGRINVREGDKVVKGQILVSLDKVKLSAAVDEGRAKVAALRTSMSRIEAELFDRPLQFPPEVASYTDFVQNQTLLYQKRRSTLSSVLSTMSRQLAYTRQELDMNQPLLAQGDVSETEVLRLRRSETEIEGQMLAQKNKYLTDLQAEYTKTQEDLVSAQETLKQREDVFQNTDLLAPTTGVVKNVRVTTVGGVLKPGDEMLEIVPSADVLIVEAKVSPKDIAFIRKGQEASVKFDAYDSGIYGSGVGKVTFVSPDTLTDRVGNDTETYYRVHVSVSTKSMHSRRDEIVEIQPGMTATVEIKTGRSTVYRYLTKPITKTMSESLGET